MTFWPLLICLKGEQKFKFKYSLIFILVFRRYIVIGPIESAVNKTDRILSLSDIVKLIYYLLESSLQPEDCLKVILKLILHLYNILPFYKTTPTKARATFFKRADFKSTEVVKYYKTSTLKRGHSSYMTTFSTEEGNLTVLRRSI